MRLRNLITLLLVLSLCISCYLICRSQVKDLPPRVDTLNEPELHSLIDYIVRTEASQLPPSFDYDFSKDISYEIQEAYLFTSNESYLNQEKHRSGKQKDAVVTFRINWQDWDRMNLEFLVVLQNIGNGYILRQYRSSTQFRPEEYRLHDFDRDGFSEIMFVKNECGNMCTDERIEIFSYIHETSRRVFIENTYCFNTGLLWWESDYRIHSSSGTGDTLQILFTIYPTGCADSYTDGNATGNCAVRILTKPTFVYDGLNFHLLPDGEAQAFSKLRRTNCMFDHLSY
ncbi:MAG: hypothetical protein F9K24_18525 [Leptonema illini]|jgi:hypothetical protein|uniref:Uncharacterized protein n=1 Tax=Leptonema illini TaxID=183 RepID=A0A833GYK3_9LEPT|nr:MAG: hypothetical protein F9K24_18525 [Leptonema illini]